MGRALLAAASTTVAPGLGHLLLGRRRIGALLLSPFLALVLVAFNAPRSAWPSYLLAPPVLLGASICMTVAAPAWALVIVRSYRLASPGALTPGQRLIGNVFVLVLCLVVMVPLGAFAYLAHTQRAVLSTVFNGGEGGTPAALAIRQPRLNVLLLGSDAGHDRVGIRTDTVMVASIDTRTARTVLFALPRNLQRAPFPPGSAMAERFPRGFANPAAPLSGDYLLNALYRYAHEHPELAPSEPADDPGVNLVSSSVSYLLDLPLDYYVMVDMAGFASLIDAVGGVRVDVGALPLPIGGVTASGRRVKPDGYLQPGVQHLDGHQALWFARSRRDGTDYQRMSRQLCLLQAVLEQKRPSDLLVNFQALARAATANVRTNIPADGLPALAALATRRTPELASISFDPARTDGQARSGHFESADPDLTYVRQTVHAALTPESEPGGSGPPASQPETLAETCQASAPQGSVTGGSAGEVEPHG